MLRGWFKRKAKEEPVQEELLQKESEETQERESREAFAEPFFNEKTETTWEASQTESVTGTVSEAEQKEEPQEAFVVTDFAENFSEQEESFAQEVISEENTTEAMLVEEKAVAETVAEPITSEMLFSKGENENGEETKSEETPEESRGGFFKRLKEGLSKTRNAIADRLDGVLSGFRTVDEELFEELEEALIMADVGVDTSLYIIGELRKRVKEQNVKEPMALKELLKEIISELLMNQDSAVDTSKKPTVIMVIGVNGVGKTTSIGKLAARYRKEGKKVILAAADTFRAAAIDQLQIWAERADAEIVKHQEGSDPSAVVFDAIAAAKSRNADIVICDTAGRLHNKKNLMEELKKTARVIERETGSTEYEVLLVLDGSTGQNALIQAKEFASVAKITGVILTKLDGTAKGGVVIALSREQNIGVKFLGVGEGVEDLQEFRPKEFADALFGESTNE